LVSPLFTVGNFIESRVAFGIFAKQRAFDHGKRDWLTVHFCIDSADAGRAIERSQRSEYESQRLRQMRQAADSPSLDLDRPWAHDPLRRIQIQTESPA
jgi:hypothetical protein